MFWINMKYLNDRKLDKNYRGEIDEKFLDILLLIILRSPRRLSS